MAKILVVDDQPHVTHVLSIWLHKNGHEVTRANDGHDALECLRSQAFDILISDVNMPRMDGLSLIKRCNEFTFLKGIIVLTGRNDFRDLDCRHSKQNIRFAPKPFSPTAIAREVDELMSSYVSVAPS